MAALPIEHSKEACTASITAVKDTLYVLSGKWKLPIIIALTNNPRRFKDLQRSLEDITPKILSKELKELEMNEFVTRTVYATSPVTVEYELTKYSQSLNKIIDEMRVWGLQHRKRIMSKSRKEKKEAGLQNCLTNFQPKKKCSIFNVQCPIFIENTNGQFLGLTSKIIQAILAKNKYIKYLYLLILSSHSKTVFCLFYRKS